MDQKSVDILQHGCKELLLGGEQTFLGLSRCVSLKLLDRCSADSFKSSCSCSLNIFERILYQSFGFYDQKRPFPSAGSLYPVEVLVFIDRFNSLGLKAGVYHFLPKSKALELLVVRESLDLNDSFGDGSPLRGRPEFGIVFFGNVRRMSFKYGTRGYRHALVEVGAMAQNLDIVSRKYGLNTRMWSSFDDRKISLTSNLDPNAFIPLMAHMVGYENKETFLYKIIKWLSKK